MNEEWTGGPNLLQVVVVMEWRKERRRERVAEFRSEILKRSLERPALWMSALERL